ncbi:hypothetical protein ACWT_4649 [Actinoplanes sp. SE50]|uniref:hypothetical protein n=1 Tax=unclassified Actinoplanes TaxID=2626549 RepID=UPI00023ED649|nr:MULTISPECIES: hypothetical protein [unclassified Actinoplanes]AEV85671.1 hypothetical protein ACPL_4780 [Actinoplanes sp. SE50/110]ATO84064.1 hypothetical protein ACWT_4649 [Actinoplanes sp. SE50]SLM01474.1 hypothetical protein ACSP50_4710 [Actinoplanes sp. SE50/110]
MTTRPPTLRDALRSCVHTGEKIGFTLLDGRQFLGWAADVDGDRVLLSWAPSPMFAMSTDDAQWNPDDEWVPLSAIAADTAARYDEASRRWRPCC